MKERGLELVRMQQTRGTGIIPSATVILLVNGKEVQKAANGDGTVDAIFNAIKEAAGIIDACYQQDWAGRSVDGVGTEAIGKIGVMIRRKDRIKYGEGKSRNILEAWAFAFIDALNKLEKAGL